jgi:hypothetical protein
MEILNLLWSIVSFAFSLVWQFAWFILRDLLSTLLWILIAAWLLLSVRHRSFTSGTLALLRYGGYGLRYFWQWLWGTPGAVPASQRKQARVVKISRPKPLGTMSISEQLNMLLVGAIYLLLFA